MTKTLAACIENLKKLPIRKQRCVAAIVGAHVADAAARPLHWVYNLDVLKAALDTVDVPEFFPESKCPFYEVELGRTSMYNDELRDTLGYLHSNPGDGFTTQGLAEMFKEKYGPGTPIYELNKVRSKETMPIKGLWLHGTIKKLAEDLSEGKTPRNEGADDNDALLVTLPLLLVHDSAGLWEKMKEVVLTFTQHTESIRWFEAFTTLLCQFLDGQTDPFTVLKESLKDKLDMLEKLEKVETSTESFVQTVKENGYACSLPGSFLGAYLSMKKATSFQEAIRLNITAGGDSCSRGNLIGACYGALYGVENIPLAWMEKTKGIEETFEKALDIVQR